LGKGRQDIFLININWFEFSGGRDLITLPMKRGYNSPFIF